jgi:hypothetical protein
VGRNTGRSGVTEQEASGEGETGAEEEDGKEVKGVST